MDDSQQKSQIDEDARKAKEEVDTNAFNARQLLADQESEKIRKDTEEEIAQIQSDAQKQALAFIIPQLDSALVFDYDRYMLDKNNIWKALIILSSLGILLAVYLFYNFLTKPLVESCYFNSYINCDAVTKGSLSMLFGIPVSLIGLVGYIVIFLSSILKQKLLVLGISTFGMVFCLFITYQELLKIKVICPVCLACQLVMLAVFLLAIYLNFKKT